MRKEIERQMLDLTFTFIFILSSIVLFCGIGIILTFEQISPIDFGFIVCYIGIFGHIINGIVYKHKLRIHGKTEFDS